MIYYHEWFITPIEVPDELSLAFTITGCRIGCPSCHSKELWSMKGNPLTIEVLDTEIQKQKYITCVLFLGGEYDFNHLLVLNNHVKTYNLNTALYTGLTLNELHYYKYKYNVFDYIKVGPYIRKLGGLDSPTTNQRMYKHGNNITKVFWNGE